MKLRKGREYLVIFPPPKFAPNLLEKHPSMKMTLLDRDRYRLKFRSKYGHIVTILRNQIKIKNENI